MAEVGKCPKCGKSIDETHENPWCTKCGEPLPEDIKSRLPKVMAIRAAAAAARLESDDVRGQSGSAVVNRYRDAYRVGTALVGLGNAIKVVGAVLAGIIFLGALSSGNGPFGGGAVLAGVFVAAIVGVLFWACGVIIAAQGQILCATLDNAVSQSPFLTDHERLDAMGLPLTIADRGTAAA